MAHADLFHSTERWSDRPHFATREHYETRLFANLPYHARVTPEQILDQRARKASFGPRKWPLWMYGRRGDMLRDYHWPQMYDGKFVGKEFVPLSANVSNVYSHAYSIHAYTGPGAWDVSAKQISKQRFRERNPDWMRLVDQLKDNEIEEPTSSDSQAKKVKVTNLPFDLDENDITKAFEKEAGRIVDCWSENKGSIVMIFERAQDAQTAVDTYHKGELNKRTIDVELMY